jgi:hypothetical protein
VEETRRKAQQIGVTVQNPHRSAKAPTIDQILGNREGNNDVANTT